MARNHLSLHQLPCLISCARAILNKDFLKRFLAKGNQNTIHINLLVLFLALAQFLTKISSKDFLPKATPNTPTNCLLVA